MQEHKLIVADAGLRPAILALLQENDLPVEDLDESKALFAFLVDGKVAGTGGLEFLSNCALLRSISVRKDLQKKGFGRSIVGELEKVARQDGVNRLYLLTTTAEEFFNKIGYDTIDRDEVPAEVTHTTEFSSICPSSATVMRKFLS